MLKNRFRFALTISLLSALIAFQSQPAAAQQCGDDLGCGEPMNCGLGAWDLVLCQCVPASPIILDVSGRGFHLTDAAGGVLFDINADGKKEKIAWTQASSSNAFLALDRNHNGAIDDGTELFGNFTPQPSSPIKNGFLALAEYDKPENGGNGDGVIDQKDAIFSSLRLWIDSNHNGVSEPDEFFTLPSKQIRALSLRVFNDSRRDRYGNLFRYRAKAYFDDGTSRWAYDVLLTH